MRLGGYFGANSVEQLRPLCEKLDTYGLSTIPAPGRLAEMTENECGEFGEQAKKLGIFVGEAGMWENLMIESTDIREERINGTRAMLRNADIMGCHCVMTLVGTRDPSDAALAPHPYMYTEECKVEFRDVVLRILDGLELQTTKYCIEPWHNTFFYQPEDIREFIDKVDHPSFGLHLDMMNMINQEYFYNTTELINKTFDMLADTVASVHLKDVRCDFGHMFLKWDEVYIGDGVMDYETFLKRLSNLPTDVPCYCEHMPEERDYALCFARLHHIAEKVGTQFLRRNPE